MKPNSRMAPVSVLLCFPVGMCEWISGRNHGDVNTYYAHTQPRPPIMQWCQTKVYQQLTKLTRGGVTTQPSESSGELTPTRPSTATPPFTTRTIRNRLAARLPFTLTHLILSHTSAYAIPIQTATYIDSMLCMQVARMSISHKR